MSNCPSVLKIILTGRTNVGKSSIFNMLVGEKKSIVRNEKETTRDFQEAYASIGHQTFLLYDTAGFIDHPTSEMDKILRDRTMQLLKESDLVLFVVNNQEGLLSEDLEYASILRSHTQAKIILLVNKMDFITLDPQADFYRLGFENILPFSAMHNIGYGQLEDYLTTFALEKNKSHDSSAPLDKEPQPILDHVQESTINLTILGKPNVGKSSLFNHLIGFERMLTGEESGLTRDSVSLSFLYNNKPYLFTDTAGIRKNRKQYVGTVEEDAVKASLQALRNCSVLLLLIDIEEEPSMQDLVLADMAFTKGHPVLFVLTKADKIQSCEKVVLSWQERLSEKIHQTLEIPIVAISTKTGYGIQRMMKTVEKLYTMSNKKIATSQLNVWLSRLTEKHSPPYNGNQQIKIKYITQINTNPPTFLLFFSKSSSIPDHYLNFLRNQLSRFFGFSQVPILITTRKNNSP